MIICAALALTLLRQQGSQPARGADIISKMLARYASAKSLAGTITFTQSARGVSVVTQTTLAYQKPSKFLVVQRQGGSSPRFSMLVSNGDKFVFTRPQQVLSPNDFMGEPVKPDDRPGQTVGQLYTVIAPQLPDRSAMLDFFVGRPEDMTYCTSQFVSFNYAGKTQLGDQLVDTIRGTWKENGLAKSPVGQFELYVTDAGDLVRYVLRQNFAIPGQNRQLGSEPVEVVSIWDAAVTINGPISADTFALRTH